MDTFGTGTTCMCPSQRTLSLIENQLKGVQKGRYQLQVSVSARCPLRESRLYRFVALTISGKLSTYPSPKPTFCPRWEVSVNAGLGEGKVDSFPETYDSLLLSLWSWWCQSNQCFANLRSCYPYISIIYVVVPHRPCSPPPTKERLIVGHCFAERSFVIASRQFHRGLNDVTSGVCCKMAAHDAALHFQKTFIRIRWALKDQKTVSDRKHCCLISDRKIMSFTEWLYPQFSIKWPSFRQIFMLHEH